MNRIAVLTSGGDSPGMNAAIRAVVRAAVYYGLEVMGVHRGYKGLIEGNLTMLNASSVGDIVHKGGTILKSARSEEFKTETGREKAYRQLQAHNIEGLIVIGGDGSFEGARKLGQKGIKTVCIPGTIDNDLNYTEFAIGFDTAVNTVLEAVSKIRDTSTSHEKATIIEVMGRNCGDIALYAGIAGGAESIIIPEEPVRTSDVIRKLQQGNARGKQHHIIMLAEGSGSAAELQQSLLKEAEINARISVLGFIQRGGDPTSFDRILASKMGVKSVELLMNNETDKVIGVKNNKLYHMNISDALKEPRTFDAELYKLTEILSV